MRASTTLPAGYAGSVARGAVLGVRLPIHFACPEHSHVHSSSFSPHYRVLVHSRGEGGYGEFRSTMSGLTPACSGLASLAADA